MSMMVPTLRRGHPERTLSVLKRHSHAGAWERSMKGG